MHDENENMYVANSRSYLCTSWMHYVYDNYSFKHKKIKMIKSGATIFFSFLHDCRGNIWRNESHTNNHIVETGLTCILCSSATQWCSEYTQTLLSGTPRWRCFLKGHTLEVGASWTAAGKTVLQAAEQTREIRQLHLNSSLPSSPWSCLRSNG